MSNRFRDAAHQQMRQAALGAAAEEVVARGWSGLQMQTVANRVGVSRQTLYNAFGSKHGLAQALVMRHASLFLDGVEAAMSRHERLHDRWTAAVQFTLDAAAEDPLFKAVLLDDSSEEFLPLLTSEGAPVLVTARQRLADFLVRMHAELDPADVGVAVETMVRLTLSHIVLPLHPSEQVADQVATMATRYLQPLR